MKPRPALLVASPGGHAEELYALAHRFLATDTPRIWVTAKTPHTSSLLADEEVLWASPVGARQGGRALRSLPEAHRAIRRVRPGLLVSTGAALAVPFLVAARLQRVPVDYVESATRFAGPSLTGRIVESLPGVRLHHQGFSAPRRRWKVIDSVFDTYSPREVPPRPIRRVVVMVGTERFPLDRALTDVARALPPDADVTWQTGHTTGHDLPGRSAAWFDGSELAAAVHAADLVVTHAGVGSVLAALRCGHHPLVFARRSSLGEHVDDHQVELARELHRRGLVTSVQPGDDLTSLIERSRAIRTTAYAAASGRTRGRDCAE